MKLLGSNFQTPDVKWFEESEAGKEGDADQLLVAFVLSVGVLMCNICKLSG